MGGPPNHPFIDGIFHEINHPFWGTHHLWKPQYGTEQQRLKVVVFSCAQNMEVEVQQMMDSDEWYTMYIDILVGGEEHLEYFPFSWDCHHPNQYIYIYSWESQGHQQISFLISSNSMDFTTDTHWLCQNSFEQLQCMSLIYLWNMVISKVCCMLTRGYHVTKSLWQIAAHGIEVCWWMIAIWAIKTRGN